MKTEKQRELEHTAFIIAAVIILSVLKMGNCSQINILSVGIR